MTTKSIAEITMKAIAVCDQTGGNRVQQGGAKAGKTMRMVDVVALLIGRTRRSGHRRTHKS